MMKEFLKDYGALIGPFLAFFLSFIALIFKYKIDVWVNKKVLENRFLNLKKLIMESNPDKVFVYHSNKPSKKYQANNKTNFPLYFARMKIINAYTEELKKSIDSSGNPETIIKFYEIYFRFKEAFEEISEWKEKNRYESVPNDNYGELSSSWNSFSAPISWKTKSAKLVPYVNDI
jgi:hypothetical protein